MEIELRLFAIFRERAGRERLELELPEGATVADALAAAEQPGLGEILRRDARARGAQSRVRR